MTTVCKENRTLYIDLNVLSRIAQEDAPTNWLSENFQAIYSNAHFADLQDSTQVESCLRLLERVSAKRVVFENNGSLNCTLEETSPEVAYKNFRESIDAVGFENALQSFSLFAHGSKSSGTFSEVWSEMEETFSKVLEETIDTLGVSERVYSLPDDLFLFRDLNFDRAPSDNKTELESMFGRSDVFSGIRAPNLIKKVIDKFEDASQGEFRQSFNPTQLDWSELLGQACLLGMLGFGRDRDIGKSNKAIALKGARSDLNDAQHIAFGLHCAGFMTADIRAARKAFALDEYHKLNTCIVYQRPDLSSFVLSAENWL